MGGVYHNAKSINPGGIAVSEDRKRAYVALNAANTLGVVDLTASPAKLIAQIPVGNAPNSVVIHGKYAYVSNEGGRPATSADFTNDSDGTPIVVDRKDAFAITGTVSVVDLAAGKEVKTIKVGLHPAGMTICGSNLCVANAYSDSLSVIDLRSDDVVRTIDLSVPIAGGAFGSGPNGVAVTDDGRAYVTLGQANAVAVVNLQGRDAHPVIGYIPTGYFPTSIAYDKAQKQLLVADDKGLGTHVPARSGGLSGFSTHQDTGTVNLIPLPNASQLAQFSKQVFDNDHWNLTTNIEVGPEYIDAHAAPVAVPKTHRRTLIHQVRLSGHQREPHLRPDTGRRAMGRRRPQACDLCVPAFPINMHSSNVSRCSITSTLRAASRRMVIRGSGCRAPSTPMTSCRRTGFVPIRAAMPAIL